MRNHTLWHSVRTHFQLVASYAAQSTTEILNWLALGSRYLRYHTILSSNVTHFGSMLVWFLVRHVIQLTVSLSSSALSLVRFLFLVSERAAYLATLIVIVCALKSTRPRYKLYERKSVLETSGKDPGPLQTPKTAELIQYDTNKWRLLGGIKSHYMESLRECYNSLALSDISRIYEKISWSQSDLEFENVNWLNRTAQILWPSVKTIVSKGLARAMKAHSASSKQLIKAKDATSEQVKLAVYLSCRRRLKLLRKARNKILRKGDEFLSQKLIIMIVYMIRRLAILLKQFLMDHIRGLIGLLTAADQKEESTASQGSREIDLDVAEMLKKSDIVYRSRQTRSGLSPESGGSRKLLGVRHYSAPSFSRYSSSRRIMSGGLISSAQLQKCRNKRQHLVHKLNQAYEAARDAKGKKKVVLEHLDLGNSAPRLTAIKYLDKDDSTKLLARYMHIHNTRLSASTGQIMRLLIEVDFSSDNHFSARLSALPILDQVELRRINFRARILVTANHDTFAKISRNLDIRDSPSNGSLLPILNYIQLSLVDVPQLDWYLRKPKEYKSPMTKRKRRHRKSNSFSSRREENNPIMSLVRHTRKVLRPINIINHPYLKYLIYSTSSLLQRWLQPFDILIGDRVRLRTLH